MRHHPYPPGTHELSHSCKASKDQNKNHVMRDQMKESEREENV